MRLWWLLVVLAALLVLIWRLRIGVRVVLAQGLWTVTLRIGPCAIRLYPPKQKQEAPQPEAPAEQPAQEEAPAKSGFRFPKWNGEQIRDAVQTLWPPLRRALERTRRGIRIAPLHASVIVGAAADPAAGARTYGLLQWGVWTGMPVLEQLVSVRNPQIHVGLDFQTEHTTAQGEAELSLRLGTGVRVAVGIAVPVLRVFLRMQRQTRRKTAPKVNTTA